MRGARVAVAFLAAFPGVTAINLLMHPPRGIRVTSTLALRVDAHPSYALVGTLVLSVLALALAFFFGGMTKRGQKSEPAPAPPAPPSSAGHTLH